MGLIEKLENFVNKLLILIGDLVVRAFSKVVPPKVTLFFSRIGNLIGRLLTFLKDSPGLLIKATPLLISKTKSFFADYNFKAKLNETYKSAMAQYAKAQPGSKITGLKKALLTPFLMLGQWVKGLTSAQTAMLLTFSAASVLAAINIVFSGNRILDQHRKESRAPASVEEEISYDRPDYYKKQTRHLEMSSIRLPVYFANVNELRSIDIDFIATMSNRLSRMKLERLEFQLRDHLILHIEPMVASFPLEDEGKEIIREKLHMEINDFLINHQIEGEVKDLKLTYILAN